LGDLPQELQLLLVLVDSGQLLGVVVVRWVILAVLMIMGVTRARPGLSLLVFVCVLRRRAAAVAVAMTMSATRSCNEK